MQVKKDEMRTSILEAATDEFLVRGFPDASMRIIARKAHTSIGNIYRYFQNKEMLLEAVVSPTLDRIERMLDEHIAASEGTGGSACRVEELVRSFESNELLVFTDKRVLILLDLTGSRLLPRKEAFLGRLRAHFRWHVPVDEDGWCAKVVVDMIIAFARHALLEHDDPSDIENEFIRFAHFLQTGIVGTLPMIEGGRR